MKRDCAEVDQITRHLVDECKDRIRNALRNPSQNFTGDTENGPVVDLKNSFPDLQNPSAGRSTAHPLRFLRPRNARVPLNRAVKDEGVHKNRNRHAAGLFPRLLMQHPSDAFFHIGAFSQGSQSRAARAHPFLQSGLAFPHHPFGQGQQFNSVRQIVHRTRQPLVIALGPACRRASTLALVYREPKPGPFQAPGRETVRIDQGHTGLNGQGVGLDDPAQACLHLPSQLGRVSPEFGLNRHGLAAVRNDQYIDFFSFMVAQNPRRVDEHVVLVPPRMPRDQQLTQLAVQDGFRLDGRRSGHVDFHLIGTCFVQDGHSRLLGDHPHANRHPPPTVVETTFPVSTRVRWEVPTARAALRTCPGVE